jgi:RNA recognition motif-containing protein
VGIRLIVDGLPQHCFEEELIGLFAPFGSVLSAQLTRDHLHNVLGFGFVEMASVAEACRAAFALDGKELHGHTIHVALVTESPLGAV